VHRLCGYNAVIADRSGVAVRRPAEARAHAVANLEAQHRPPTNAPTIDARESVPAAHPYLEGLVAFAAALALCLLGYLAAVVPGAWFPAASPMGWTADRLALARGAGGFQSGELVATAPDATGTTLVTVTTDFRSSDYRAIAWSASGLSEQTTAWLIWRTDYAPAKLNSVQLTVASGRLLPISLATEPDWVGRITGLALTLRGPLPQPVRIRGVTAKPMGAVELAGDRVREWLAFEGFTGASINGVTGGADVQDLPLPVLLATAIAVAALGWYGLARARGKVAALPAVLATLFVVAWLVQDARWTWDLARQALESARRYAGRDLREQHLAAEDGALYAFIEHVRDKLPSTPVRVFMVADEQYFRARGAYHLYPNNVHFDPYRNTIPAGSRLRPGDYVVVYRRRGVQFDPAAQRLRWDGGQPVEAELLLSEPGAALFRIR
jgi:hypothetical protein